MSAFFLQKSSFFGLQSCFSYAANAQSLDPYRKNNLPTCTLTRLDAVEINVDLSHEKTQMDKGDGRGTNRKMERAKNDGEEENIRPVFLSPRWRGREKNRSDVFLLSVFLLTLEGGVWRGGNCVLRIRERRVDSEVKEG